MLRLPRLQTAMMKFQYPGFSTLYCSGFIDSDDEVLVPRPMLFYLPSSPHPFLRPQPCPEIMFYLMILGLVHIDLLLLFLSSPALVATSSVACCMLPNLLSACSTSQELPAKLLI
jgi:hypothetical protein